MRGPVIAPGLGKAAATVSRAEPLLHRYSGLNTFVPILEYGADSLGYFSPSGSPVATACRNLSEPSGSSDREYASL